MRSYTITLTEDEFAKLERDFPNGPKNNSTRDRAVEITKIFILRERPDAHITIAAKSTGADLTIAENLISADIEVKGTAEEDIAWQKIGVSGEPSYKGILNGREVYRVCGVFSKKPTIHILKHGVDFTMVPEPRWRFKPIK